ncbi:hypothetical protein FRC00_012262 [Tulasnella sp. 408]|nr:hypothetical protein FRC00_012262 [Tulasnella sp. 408]
MVDNRNFELIVRQQPKQARMCGVGGKADRRPIDPPPIVQLRVTTPNDASGGLPPINADKEASAFLQNPYYFMFASLAAPDSDEELHLLKDGKTRYTTGSVVSSLYHLKDHENGGKDAGFFVFPDLSVRTEGSYRLKLSLFEVVGQVYPPPVAVNLRMARALNLPSSPPHSAQVHHCKSIFSKPFYVYTAKKFPGMEGKSSSLPYRLLSCSLADQGIKIRIRKDIRVRKRPVQIPEIIPMPLEEEPDSGTQSPQHPPPPPVAPPQHHRTDSAQGTKRARESTAGSTTSAASPDPNSKSKAAGQSIGRDSKRARVDTGASSTPSIGGATTAVETPVQASASIPPALGPPPPSSTGYPAQPPHAVPAPAPSQHYHQPATEPSGSAPPYAASSASAAPGYGSHYQPPPPPPNGQAYPQQQYPDYRAAPHGQPLPPPAHPGYSSQYPAQYGQPQAGYHGHQQPPASAAPHMQHNQTAPSTSTAPPPAQQMPPNYAGNSWNSSNGQAPQQPGYGQPSSSYSRGHYDQYEQQPPQNYAQPPPSAGPSTAPPAPYGATTAPGYGSYSATPPSPATAVPSGSNYRERHPSANAPMERQNSTGGSVASGYERPQSGSRPPAQQPAYGNWQQQAPVQSVAAGGPGSTVPAAGSTPAANDPYGRRGVTPPTNPAAPPPPQYAQQQYQGYQTQQPPPPSQYPPHAANQYSYPPANNTQYPHYGGQPYQPAPQQQQPNTYGQQRWPPEQQGGYAQPVEERRASGSGGDKIQLPPLRSDSQPSYYPPGSSTAPGYQQAPAGYSPPKPGAPYGTSYRTDPYAQQQQPGYGQPPHGYAAASYGHHHAHPAAPGPRTPGGGNANGRKNPLSIGNIVDEG